MAQYVEGPYIVEDQPDGSRKVVGYADQQSSVVPPDPIRLAEKQAQLRQQQVSTQFEPALKGAQLQNAQNQQPNEQFNQRDKLRADWEGLAPVKEYRAAVSALASALKTAPDAGGDNALIYAYAKIMDPASVVRESEMQMASGTDSTISAAAARFAKEFGMEGGGQLSQKTRDRLRREAINSVSSRVKIYNNQRERFSEYARKSGYDPYDIVGPHDGNPFVEEFKGYGKPEDGDLQTFEVIGPDGKRSTFTAPKNATDDEVRKIGIQATQDPGISRSEIQRGDYEDSYLGQGLSGVNEGIASTLGAPVDLVTAGLNLIPQGINALANTDIPAIQNPTLGSEQIKGWMRGGGMAFDESQDPSKQFARRVGQSVGAAAVPLGGGAANLGRQMLIGGGGGIGAATAQQAFPGNKMAEMAGEVLGGGTTAGGLIGSMKRNATRQIEAAVPTVPQLKEQAAGLYQQAERRGVTASPSQTQQLRDEFEQTLRNEGQLGPAGRISDADTNTTKAFNLIDQYAGGPMRPVEMDTVRGVIADGRKSMDPSDQRLSGLLTDQFDDWARPLAPEFDQARDVSSRYLQAQDLEEARQLAEAGASQFGQSGLENALRTQYRGLDRADIKGKSYFNPDVSEAIQRVGRGTLASNAARNLGRFAPTGPMSLATSVGVPAIAGGAFAGPIGGAIGSTLGLAGIGGRVAANAMTNRAVDVAELTARNGGRLPEANVMTPEVLQMLAAQSGVQAAKYVPPETKPKPKKRSMFKSRSK
jgi:hypothetical protein